MHDNEAMALMPRDRISPLQLGLHHIHTLPFDFHSKKSFEPLYKDPIHESIPIHYDDDDDFSDHDSHYSEDEIDTLPLPCCHVEQDITRRLLNFADMVNSDIQKFFGRRKGEEDSCDIYEDKWTSGKSGRELYYMDLLKIAQGGDGDKPKKSSKSNTSKQEIVDNRDNYSGVMDKKAGLGPLNELFEHGLKNFLTETHPRNGKQGSKRQKVDHNKHTNTIPLTHRKLPDSFWREPGILDFERLSSPGLHPSLHPVKPPDFTDLLHHWTGHTADSVVFPTDLSASDMSLTSTASV